MTQWTAIASATLAEVPPAGGYFALYKLVLMALGVTGWLAICQWVDKDTLRLRYRRFTWNGVVVGSGLVGTVLWLLIPSFLLGLLCYVTVVGIAVGTYVYLRNQLPGLSPAGRVLTAEHLRYLFRRRLPDRKPPPAPVRLMTWSHQEVPALGQDDPLFGGFQAGQMLLTEALARRVGRLAISPTARGAGVWYTIDGVELEPRALDRQSADLVIAYFKRVAGMDVNDRRRPQTGRLRAEEPAQPVDEQTLAAGYAVPPVIPARRLTIDLRTSGTRAGESMVMLLASEDEPLTLERLGLTERQLQSLTDFRRQPGGVVILGASEGIGSTTTFYRALRAHDVFMSNVQTLEEQPEAELENITQHAFRTESGEDGSFARQLQSILRRGPDIVGVSLCRDKETAQLIAHAASEHVKSYVQMAGKDTFTLLTQWVALVGDGRLAAGPLHLVVAQALLRKLCPGCREAYRPDPQLLRKINLPPDRIDRLYRPPTRIPVDKQGNQILCPLCQGTGYLGRTGVFEVLAVDDEVRRLVAANASANEIKKYCRTQKMLYLQEEALRKVIAGQTSINEVLRVFREAV